MKKITPILIVEHVDSCASFWTGALGFERTAEVPHGGETGFVILQKGEVEIMYQSRASVRDDLPALAEGPYRSVSSSRPAISTPSSAPSIRQP